MKAKEAETLARDIVNLGVELGMHSGGGKGTLTPDERDDFYVKLRDLKQKGGCHIEDFKQFQKRMPLTAEFTNVGGPRDYPHTETYRHVLREITACILEENLK